MPRFFRLLPPVCWLAFGLAWMSPRSGLHAELSWDRKTVELNADAQTSVLTAQFKFANKGRAAVDVEKVESSCGCTVATLQARHFELGQSGEITATFTVGDRTGLQKKTIAVTSSDHPYPTMLTLIVHIPEIMHLQPAAVTWKHAEKSEAKTIVVEILQETPLANIKVESSNPEVLAAIHPLQEEGHRYEITVTPAKTDQSLFATLTIHCFFGKVEKVFHAYASVQPPMPAQ